MAATTLSAGVDDTFAGCAWITSKAVMSVIHTSDLSINPTDLIPVVRVDLYILHIPSLYLCT